MEQFILFLIIAAVGAIFKKFSSPRNSSDSENKPVAPKTPLKEIVKKNIENVKTEIQSRQNEPTVAPEVKTIVENHSDNKLDELRIQEEMYLKKLDATKKSVASIKENKMGGITTDQNDIVKGIILSEVLGPPRARKPYKR